MDLYILPNNLFIRHVTVDNYQIVRIKNIIDLLKKVAREISQTGDFIIEPINIWSRV